MSLLLIAVIALATVLVIIVAIAVSFAGSTFSFGHKPRLGEGPCSTHLIDASGKDFGKGHTAP